MKKLLTFYKIISTGFGIGYFPLMPGTVAAAFGCLVWAALNHYGLLNNVGLSLLVIATFFLGVFASGKLVDNWGKDPSKIVIDEIVGVWIALWMLPFNWVTLIAGFVFFRIFDIWKPLFIKRTEKLQSGWGIMVDDVVAGIYANILVRVLLLFFKIA